MSWCASLRGGREHAKRVCTKNHIAKYMKVFMDKPDIIVDDHPETLLSTVAILLVDSPEMWKKDDGELFQGSRKYKITIDKEG